MRYRCFLVFIAAFFCVTSCEKKEEAIVLPPQGPASHDSIVMGVNYDKQIFYDFETGLSVYSSNHDAWDLAFEGGPDGRNIYINGGQGAGTGQTVCIYNTHD